jgi:hypothetical protein
MMDLAAENLISEYPFTELPKFMKKKENYI